MSNLIGINPISYNIVRFSGSSSFFTPCDFYHIASNTFARAKTSDIIAHVTVELLSPTMLEI